MQDQFIKMNGAVLFALVASALVAVSTANPAELCQTPGGMLLGKAVPKIAKKCGKCSCDDVRQLQRLFIQLTRIDNKIPYILFNVMGGLSGIVHN